MSVSQNTNNYQANGTAQTYAGSSSSFGYGDNPSAFRLNAAGLFPGANSVLGDIANQVFNINFQGADGTPLSGDNDWRVRVTVSSKVKSILFNGNALMSQLSSMGGVVFPYTPEIAITHNARYNPTQLTHSNYSSYFYEGSEVASITIGAEFTVQNYAEGQYLMAAIQFFRSCTKMFWGSDNNAGAPPPLVFLDGYGQTYLPHVPCVVTSVGHTMPSEVDYMEIPIGRSVNAMTVGQLQSQVNSGGVVRLPTSSKLQITLQPVYSRNNLANNFTLSKYAQGAGAPNNRGGFL